MRTRQQETVADLQETVRLSTARYQGGTSTYLEVLDAQRSHYAAELTLAESRGNEYRSLVQLYKALGGGWQGQDSQAQTAHLMSPSNGGGSSQHQ